MMRLSSAIVVLMIVAAASSAGIYPATTGSKGAALGRTKSGTNRDTSGDSFHVQSPDGQYVFGHANGEQGRAEMRDSDGTVTGYYSYADGDGRVVRVDYVADKGGYRVLSNTGVPSASVTVEAEDGGAPAAVSDFRKMYSDLTRRIKSKVVQRGQKVVDTNGGGQRPVVIDPIPYPTEEVSACFINTYK
ncbi:Cuticle protein 6 [Aphis craccivora]|uniref:Cuticle protein 6 n=1 Tax=Aphis craccivora TaxID=307492 RepID=A0A6G0YU55_APHCR|nr:Cuticle protein 6 [Aphis craccivora]